MRSRGLPMFLFLGLGALVGVALAGVGEAQRSPLWQQCVREQRSTWSAVWRFVTFRANALDNAVEALEDGRVAESVQEADRRLAEHADDEVAWIVRAAAHRSAGRHEQAAADMRRAIELRPDEPRYRMLLGDTLAEAHAWDEAATAYAAVPATAPQYYESLLALASVERDRGQPQQSFTTLSRAILADADRSEGYEQMAVLLAAVPDQSIRNLSRAQQAAELALARADAPDERARALDAIGIVYAADGDFVTAETYAREALRLSPSDDTKLSNAIESRIAQYRQRRAFILPRVAVNPAQASGDLDPLRAS